MTEDKGLSPSGKEGTSTIRSPGWRARWLRSQDLRHRTAGHLAVASMVATRKSVSGCLSTEVKPADTSGASPDWLGAIGQPYSRQ